MGVMDRYNDKKKKKEEEVSGGKATSSGVAQRYERNQYYQTLDTDSVDDQYIDTFLTFSNRFFDSVSKNAITYDTATRTMESLNKRYDTIQGWLYKNRNNLDQETYNSVSSAFDGLKSSLDSAKDYYSQWESDEDYQTSLRQFGYQQKYQGKGFDQIQALLADMEDGEEKDWLASHKYGFLRNAEDFAEKSKYTTTYRGGEKFNALTGTYTDSGFDDITYDYINRNEKAVDRQRLADISYNTALLGLDNSERGEMTDDEISIFNYIYATQGSKAAYAYIDELTSDLNARQRETAQTQWAEYAKEHPVGSSVFSILESPMKGISYLGQVADYVSDGTIDQNEGYNKFSYINSTIRNVVGNTVEANWGAAGSFAYQTGMSMGDFLFNTALSGGYQPLALAIMGTGAAADTTIAAKDRGLSDNQAFALGTIAGAAEVITEKLSLDALLDMTSLSKSAVGYFLKNTLAEGSEEVESSLINLIADILISKDKSEWQQTINAYQAGGMDENEAFWHAVLDQAASLGLDFLGGALSGGVMGGGGIAINAAANAYDAKKTYGEFQGELVGEALEIDPSNTFAQRMQGRLDSGKNLSGGQLHRLVQQNEKAMTAQDMSAIQSAAENRLTELGETGDVHAVGAALAKQAAGEKLSRAERQAITNSKYGQRVANELNTENINSGDYSSAWTENIGTNRINVDEYSRIVEAAQLPQETAETTGEQSCGRSVESGAGGPD